MLAFRPAAAAAGAARMAAESASIRCVRRSSSGRTTGSTCSFCNSHPSHSQHSPVSHEMCEKYASCLRGEKRKRMEDDTLLKEPGPSSSHATKYSWPEFTGFSSTVQQDASTNALHVSDGVIPDTPTALHRAPYGQTDRQKKVCVFIRFIIVLTWV